MMLPIEIKMYGRYPQSLPGVVEPAKISRYFLGINSHLKLLSNKYLDSQEYNILKLAISDFQQHLALIRLGHGDLESLLDIFQMVFLIKVGQ